MSGHNKYDEIIDLPRHVSRKHGHMSMRQRAAQFLPFESLPRLSDALNEAARLSREQDPDSGGDGAPEDGGIPPCKDGDGYNVRKI